ncbi:Methyltransferase-like protein 21D [Mortierella alpina]|uniref:Methyltransferase-like protein 21D n=1 Tax=Mortierella alpina TaxID=64518 RepID=A0A9P6JHT3_MORAP|nr:Methyltransferase-like protein 21D [Mortierella alpina]
MRTIDNITLASREHEFNDYSIPALEIDEDPSGQLRGGVGSTIWDAAIVLAKYLERFDLLTSTAVQSSRTLNILELGAGTGIVGLAAARILSSKSAKASIVLTDKENCMPLLRRNIDKNPSHGVDVRAQMLDWEILSGILSITSTADTTSNSSSTAATSTTTAESQPNVSSTGPSSTVASDLLDREWDLIILSDCIWVPALYPSLISTLNKLVQPSHKTQLLIAFEKRNFSEEMEFFAMLGKTFRFRDIKPEEQDANYQSEDIYLFLCQRRT